jgi:factor associated with neutral sphingomyelinase activation
VFRDLRKPIGAMNQKRLDDYRSRFSEVPGEKYLYGTHYSAPGYVIGYLVRQHPMWMLKLQSGKFDNPNRLFKGIAKEWTSWLTNPGNVKELIPEFYQENTEFLLNLQKLDLGVRANNKRVEDIKLPNWALDAKDFL